MTIYVDADACPVIKITEKTAKAYGIPLVLLCDTNHRLQSDYAAVRVLDKGADSVDFALVNMCGKGDIVVTQDYGVAAMALSKKAYVIHQSGRIFDDDNIDGLLFSRHITKQIRRSSAKNHLKGPAKRTIADDESYEKALLRLIEKINGNKI